LIDRSDHILLKLCFNRKNLPADLSVTSQVFDRVTSRGIFLKKMCASDLRVRDPHRFDRVRAAGVMYQES